jgi:hypothetical protein
MNVLLMLVQLLVGVIGIVANGLLFGAGFAAGAMLVEKKLKLK